MKNYFKLIANWWKEINTEGYEGSVSIELSLEQIILIVGGILFLLWIVLK